MMAETLTTGMVVIEAENASDLMKVWLRSVVCSPLAIREWTAYEVAPWCRGGVKAS
ncbi:MAG: hypothetical protein L7U72_09555 [Rubripirellula sp.]|nr:hypothetical protein [Rubripirellula sp.]